VIVVDASAILDLVLNRAPAAALRSRFFEAEETLHAPHLVDVEVLQVIRRYVLAGEVDDHRALEAIEVFLDLPIARYPHDVLISRAWQLRSNFTAYDAMYVSLAEVLGATLVTSDSRLAQACKRLAVSAEVVT
jgi:predicted nucleic acid-binding protein